MNNKPSIIKEEEGKTVNTVQLSDLFASGSKVETSIIQLSTMAVSFSNPAIKKKVQQLRSIAHELNDMIADAMTGAEMTAATDTKQDLEARTDDKDVIPEQTSQPVLESAKIGKQVIALMKTANLSLQEAKEFIKEYGYTPLNEGVFDASEPDNNPLESGESRQDDPEEDTYTDRQQNESIDLSGAYALVDNGSIAPHLVENFSRIVLDRIPQTLRESMVSIRQALKKADTPQELNEALNALYDFADANDVTILN